MDMRKSASQPLLRHFEEGDNDDEELEEDLRFGTKGKALRDINSTSNQMSCMSLHKRQPKKPCDEFFTCEKYWTLKQGQKAGAARLRKQLKSRLAIQKLIDDQLMRFEAHYNHAMVPTRMSDVAQILMPKWIPAHELAAVFWLGDWRPSTILELLCSLSHSSWDPDGALAQLINDVRIEEAVINEEMTEIQSNCILNLPFIPMKNEGSGPPLSQVRSEFKKIHRVILKAQNLRMKALALSVKRLLCQSDAAEFLIAFVGIQDAIHEYSMKCKVRGSPVCIKEHPRVSSLRVKADSRIDSDLDDGGSNCDGVVCGNVGEPIVSERAAKQGWARA